jgi:hypothetical protein
MGRHAQNCRILFALFFQSFKCFSREKKTKKQKTEQKPKQNKKHKNHLSSSDPDHVVNRKGSLNMSRQENTTYM